MQDQDELRERRDAEGEALPDVVARHGVDLDRATEARRQLKGAAAYLELHIEQGPVLESMGLPLGVVLGTFGVERHQVTFRGQAARAGVPTVMLFVQSLRGLSHTKLEDTKPEHLELAVRALDALATKTIAKIAYS